MKKEKMWNELAKHYDEIYYWKNYRKESEKIHRIIKKYKKTKGREILDVACGTGNHIQFLKRHYKITGIDLNQVMLRQARKKFPKLKFLKANMSSFKLNKKFDIITCLFSSIAYVKNYKKLNKTIACFSKHLKPGGVLIIEPFFTRKTYGSGKLYTVFVDKPDFKLVRMNLSKKIGNTGIIDFHFLVGTKKGVTYIRDKHEVGLFDINKFLDIMKANGFEAKYLKQGLMKDRGLYLGIKN